MILKVTYEQIPPGACVFRSTADNALRPKEGKLISSDHFSNLMIGRKQERKFQKVSAYFVVG